MNIFFREMKANRRSLIIWCIGMFFMIAASMVKYSNLSGAGQSFNEIMAQIPKSVQTVLGLGAFDLAKASGFYGVVFLYIVVMATIHASMLGAGIISKEERDKTSEFLMVKPVSRTDIITAKLSAAFVNIIILNIITLVSSIAMVARFSNGEDVTGDILVLMVGLLFLQLIFLFIGTGIAAISKNPKTAASLATGILLITFLLYEAINLNSSLEFLKYITPFKYFDAKDLMYGGGFSLVFVILSVLIIAALSSMTYMFYKKRDLNI